MIISRIFSFEALTCTLYRAILQAFRATLQEKVVSLTKVSPKIMWKPIVKSLLDSNKYEKPKKKNAKDPKLTKQFK